MFPYFKLNGEVTAQVPEKHSRGRWDFLGVF